MKTRITILGAGESGTGAALLAKARGYEVFVSDMGQIGDSYKAELIKENIPFEEGTHSEERICDASLVIKSPGIPDEAPIVQKIKAASVEMIDEVEFAFRHTTGKVIAITGTNGKTTTTLLIYHLMKEAGFDVALVGNVGYSFAREVAVREHDWYVLEISSFQLDGTKTFDPAIAILLNITPDHLNRYDHSIQKYADSKFQLIRQMRADQSFIYYTDDPIIAEEVKARKIDPQQVKVSLMSGAGAKAYYDGTQMSFLLDDAFQIEQKDTTLKGPHNLINTMAAVCAVYLAGVTLEDIRKGLHTFKNAPHRLESIAVVNGVEFVNDSKATNVDAVHYALGSYEGPLIWIAGGVDKGNDYTLIRDEVGKKVRILICLGKDNEKLKKAFQNIVSVIEETQSVKELVRMALEAARKGDVVLLSPACASFDLFKNYQDRGDQFRKEVLALKEALEKV